MKKILITGAGSYIGTSFEKYISKFGGYQVDTVDMTDDSWRKKDFSLYDVVFHVAGIAHSNVFNVSEDLRNKYFDVNTGLTIETANKAKTENVGQFIFMSSIIVFGSGNEIITEDTIPNPDNFYGESKLRADVAIQSLNDENFKVVSVRPPMIYGKGSKGNYPKLAAFAKKIPVFPKYNNKRSMLHIENLCEFLRLIIDNCESGYFYPQNNEYVSTSELVKTISKVTGKKVFIVPFPSSVIRFFARKIKFFDKLFGNLAYDKKMSGLGKWNYCINDFDESIKKTEM